MFIKVTDKNHNIKRGISINYITDIEELTSGSTIFLTNAVRIYVKETLEEILKMIKEQGD
jgi:hypothetical protein